MWITRPAVAAMLVAATSLPALAHPIEIVTLGRAPLMGQSTNAQELKYNFKHHEAEMRQAAAAIGLTREQYEQFRLQLDVARPAWVTIPRHLDAMTWASYGQVHVLHDVIIPANQKGVEVDLQAPGKNIALFLPAKCGNLSVIRTPVRARRQRRAQLPGPARRRDLAAAAPAGRGRSAGAGAGRRRGSAAGRHRSGRRAPRRRPLAARRADPLRRAYQQQWAADNARSGYDRRAAAADVHLPAAAAVPLDD